MVPQVVCWIQERLTEPIYEKSIAKHCRGIRKFAINFELRNPALCPPVGNCCAIHYEWLQCRSPHLKAFDSKHLLHGNSLPFHSLIFTLNLSGLPERTLSVTPLQERTRRNTRIVKDNIPPEE